MLIAYKPCLLVRLCGSADTDKLIESNRLTHSPTFHAQPSSQRSLNAKSVCRPAETRLLNTHMCAVQVIADQYSKLDKELLEMIEDVLLNRCENSTERMLEYAGTLDPKCKPTDVKKKGAAPGAKVTGGKEKSWRDESVEKRLQHAMVKGIDEFAVRVRDCMLPRAVTYSDVLRCLAQRQLHAACNAW